MNSHLRQKILNKLLNVYEVQSNYSLRPGNIFGSAKKNDEGLDLADTTALLELIDRQVTPIANIWNDVRVGVQRARLDTDAKDAVQAEVSLAEGKFRLHKYINKLAVNKSKESRDKKSSKKDVKELKAILDLADEAVLYCPTTEKGDTKAEMYALRAQVLEVSGQLEAALVNIERALSLMAPTPTMYYVLKKVKLLLDIGQVPLKEVAKYVKDLKTDELQQLSTEVYRQWSALLGRLEELSLLENDEDEETIKRDHLQEEHQGYHVNCSSTERGRSLTASSDLSSGATVLVESAYSVVLQAAQLLRRCAFCLLPVAHRWVPCTSCVSAVYCNEQCASGHSQGHQAECGLLKVLLTMTPSTEKKVRKNDVSLLKLMHVYRQFVQAKSVQEVLTVAVADLSQDLEFEKGKTSLELMLFLEHSSKEEFDREETSPEVVDALQCAMIFLIANGYEFEQITTEQLVAFVRLTFLNARKVSVNSFLWSEYDEEFGEKMMVGSVLALRSSLLNHSCQANAAWTPIYPDDGGSHLKVKIVTSKRVAVGEELTINYLAHHLNQSSLSSFGQVRRLLQMQYNFICNCPHCLEAIQFDGSIYLQCPLCPGPVLLPLDDEDMYSEEFGFGKCLLCSTLLSGARETVKKVERAREALHLIARLIDGVVGDEKKRQFYLQKIKSALELVLHAVYRQSAFLLEDIYAVCKMLMRESDQNLELCLAYGRIVDEQLLPLEGTKLLALGKTVKDGPFKKISAHSSSPFADVFDLNIEHLLFWAVVVFGPWKNKKLVTERTYEVDDSWKIISGSRFTSRLKVVLELVIAEKERRLLPPKLEQYQDFASVGLREEIVLLKELLQSQL